MMWYDWVAVKQEEETIAFEMDIKKGLFNDYPVGFQTFPEDTGNEGNINSGEISSLMTIFSLVVVPTNTLLGFDTKLRA